MSLELLENYFDERTDPKDLLFTWRKRSWDRFLEMGLPKPLKDLSFPPLAETAPAIIAPAPIVCLPLESAMRSYGLFLQNRFAEWLKEETDPFAALNSALQGKGFFLYVPPKARLEIPIEIHSHFLEGQMVSPRIHLYLGKGSSVQLIQRAEGSGLSNTALDIVLDENAELSFVDHKALSPHAHHFQAIRTKLKRDSRFHFTSIRSGSALCRTSLNVQLCEENCEVHLRGLSRLMGELQDHIYTLVEHQAPNARSRQHFKSVLNDKSTFSFEGKILVRPEAQKTESYQLCNSLLLSSEAKTNAKPNLEIFADDVKASHGATIGQLDKEALFYLCSRGLSREEAKQQLIDAFCGEILEASHA